MRDFPAGGLVLNKRAVLNAKGVRDRPCHRAILIGC